MKQIGKESNRMQGKVGREMGGGKKGGPKWKR